MSRWLWTTVYVSYYCLAAVVNMRLMPVWRFSESINQFYLLKMSRDTHIRLFNCEQDNKAETSTNSCPTNTVNYSLLWKKRKTQRVQKSWQWREHTLYQVLNRFLLNRLISEFWVNTSNDADDDCWCLCSQIHMKTMPTLIFRLLTGQDVPHYIWDVYVLMLHFVLIRLQNNLQLGLQCD